MTGHLEPDRSDGSRAVEEEVAFLRAENARLRAILGMEGHDDSPPTAWRPTLFSDPGATPDRGPVDRNSSREAKLALFRRLFVGRPDVYAARWENDRTGKAGWSPQVEGGWANARGPDKRYLPLNDDVLRRHLAGGSHIGLYPLMAGDTCRLLACDFDGTGWLLDALPFTTRLEHPEFQRRWRDPYRGMADMYGCSSNNRFRLPRPVESGSICSEKQ